jgi:ABC-type multidrug transport system ATPase subunit
VAAQPLAYRRQVFWCGPGAVAFEHLRPPEYFSFLRGLYPSMDEALLQAQVTGFGLMPFLGKPLQALSTGTQRKVWLAAALAVGTPLVLLDEPLNALDAASLAHLHGQFRRCAASPAQAWLAASHEALGAGLPLASVIDLTGT